MEFLDQGKWNDDDDDDLETDLYNQHVEKHNKEAEEIDDYNKAIEDASGIINKSNSLMATTMFALGFILAWLIK